VRITRRGKTIARLVPDHSASEAAPQAWAERLKRFQQEQPALSSSGVALVRALRQES
jgi:antitoxin (DNA-binding transcriptional repressor) of toxin-antitoxin stability system